MKGDSSEVVVSRFFLAAALLISGIAGALVSCDEEGPKAPPPQTPTALPTALPTAPTHAKDDPGEAAAVQRALEGSSLAVAVETTRGTFYVALDREAAPATVANFLGYVESGFYSDTLFHRVIADFVVQGGGFTADLKKKETRPPIKLERAKGLSNVRGSVAMARTAATDSATSQFFVNVTDNPQLDSYRGGYAVFGKVVYGMEVVDKIRGGKTRKAAGHSNLPMERVIITAIEYAKGQPAKGTTP